MSVELERLIISLIGDASSYYKMLADAKKETEVFTESVKKSTDHIKGFSSGMGQFSDSVGGIVGELKKFTSIASDFSSFDKAMTYSQSIMSVTKDQAKALTDQALELASSGAKSANLFAESYYYLASAGLNVNQSMAALPMISKFATAGMFDMAKATTLANDAQAALGLKSQDTQVHLANLTRVTDVLTRASVLANANIEQFSVALTSKAASALKSTNKSIEEGVAVLAAMADQGIKSELAGNSLSRMLLLLQKAAIDNKEEMKLLGVEVYDTSTGAMRNLADILESMETSFVGMSDEAKSAALDMMGFEARIQGAILPLIGISGRVRGYQKELELAGGYTEMVSKKIKSSLSSQLGTLANQISVASIKFGQEFAPVIIQVSQALTPLFQGVSSLTSSFNWLIADITKSIMVFMLVVKTLPLVVSAVIGLKTAVVSLWGAMLANPITAIVAAVIALTPLIIELATAFGTVDKAAGDFNETLAGIVTTSQQLNKAKFTRTQSEVEKAKALPRDEVKGGLESGLNKALKEAEIAQKRIDDFKGRYDKLSNTSYIMSKLAHNLPFLGFKELNKAQMDGLKEDLRGAEERTNAFKTELEKLERAAKGPSISKLTIDVKNFESKLKKEIETLGLSGDALERYNLAKDKEKNKSDVSFANVDKLIAEKQMREESLKNAKAIADFNNSLKEQIDTLGMTSREIEIYKFQKNGMAAADINAAKQLDKTLTKLEKERDIKKRGEDLTKEFRTPQEKQKDTIQELDELLKNGAISYETYTRAIKKTGEETKKTTQATKDMQGVAFGSSESFSKIMAYNDSLRIKNSKDKLSNKNDQLIYGASFNPHGLGNKNDQLNYGASFNPRGLGNKNNQLNYGASFTGIGSNVNTNNKPTDLMVTMIEHLEKISDNTSDSITVGIS